MPTKEVMSYSVSRVVPTGPFVILDTSEVVMGTKEMFYFFTVARPSCVALLVAVYDSGGQ